MMTIQTLLRLRPIKRLIFKMITLTIITETSQTKSFLRMKTLRKRLKKARRKKKLIVKRLQMTTKIKMMLRITRMEHRKKRPPNQLQLTLQKSWKRPKFPNFQIWTVWSLRHRYHQQQLLRRHLRLLKNPWNSLPKRLKCLQLQKWP